MPEDDHHVKDSFDLVCLAIRRGVVMVPTDTLGTITWFVPGVIASVIVGVAVAAPFARILAEPSAVSLLFLVSLGAILSATLTPIQSVGSATPITSCDLRRLVLASPDAMRTINDSSLNILLFVPMGIALGLLRPSRHKVVLVAAAVALPIAIEWVQLAVQVLGRSCQSADVVDNLTGLALGLIAGSVLGIVIHGGVMGRMTARAR